MQKHPFFSTSLSFKAILPLLIILVGLSCGLPSRVAPTPTPSATLPGPTAPPSTPTALPTPLPPAVVESIPLPGAEIPLVSPITLYFNQPMDRASVEGALSGQPQLSGRFEWSDDDAALTFTPDSPFLPNTTLTINLNTTAQSQRGLALLEPVLITYNTAGFLRPAQFLPEPGADEIDPSSAVVVTFNRPVVPLGADPASLPVAFTIDPSAGGAGEWLNTSTYIFYPDPGLAGGTAYTVNLNPELTSTDGTPLESTKGWSFTTANPRLVSMQPENNTFGSRLDANVSLTFNVSMDSASVEANFSVLDPQGQPVPGEIGWDETFTTLSFTPTIILERDAGYTTVLQAAAQALGGTPLGSPVRAVWQTVPTLQVYETDPFEGDILQMYRSVSIYLSSDLPLEDIQQYVSISPELPNMFVYWASYDRNLSISGSFVPETEYQIIISPDLTDLWGSSLGEPFVLKFQVASLEPNLIFPFYNPIFLTGRDAGIPAQAASITSLPLSLGSLTLDEFIALRGPNGYELGLSFQPADLRTWVYPLNAPTGHFTDVKIPVSPDGNPLQPGLYMLRVNLADNVYSASPTLLVVSNYQTTFKISATDALAWVVNIEDNTPVVGASVAIYGEDGSLLASGQTDSEGVFRDSLPVQSEPYEYKYAVIGQPGQDDFGLAVSTWSDGVAPWDFGYDTDFSPPGIKTYLYTDRPIYRPGQTVYFRAILRQAYNGRYELPAPGSYTVYLYDEIYQKIATFELPLSSYGTAHGEFALPSDAQPGTYRLESDQASVYFDVSEYRKPEINLQVTFLKDQILAGESLIAQVDARYYFDAPAGNLPAKWALYAAPSDFTIPGGFQVGAHDPGWMSPTYYYPNYSDPLGILIDQGEASTDADGILILELPTEFAESRQQFTLEVTVQDESGLPVSARSRAQVNPAEFYIGVRPDLWFAQADQEAGFEVLVVNWQGVPVGSHSLQALFHKVVWERLDTSVPGEYPSFIPTYTLVGSTDFSTGSDGKARLAFTPPEPGTYQLDISGSGALTQILLWAGGPGDPVWPDVPNQHIQLTADREAYQPGETAQVFIPNPLGEGALALVTLERGIILRHQVISLELAGSTLTVPLSADDAPNLYMAVTLLGKNAQGYPDFRQGYLNLPVAPVEQTLSVSLTSQPEQAGPGDSITLDILVVDSAGNPVQGEFSLSLADLAALALADPNAPDIVPAFYGNQFIGVRTASSLAAYAYRNSFIPGGMGGGGGDGATVPVVREYFPDTAYWNATVVTAADGKAQVTITLPDSLTTWIADTRGVTEDTRVGQDQASVVTSKVLLVRPVVPRFLVAGDHALLAAVVHNNTASDLSVEVALQATGFTLDDPATAIQTVQVPAVGRARVDWWGSAQDVSSADLVFSARSGNLQDAARPALGALPILRYSTPQTFATSGVMDQPGERLELISLPVTTDSTGGSLRVELAPSLAASMLTALDVLEHYPYECTEQTLSRFLPNLEAYRALQTFGIAAPDIQDRLERTIEAGLAKLLASQRNDGGWGWWSGDASDPYLTAYVLFGLARAAQASISVSPDATQRAIDYLVASLYTPEMATESWMLNRLAFIHYALAQAGSGDLGGASALYGVRDQLSPWAQAFLAYTLDTLVPGNPRTNTLVSDLQGSAVRSASGAYWDDPLLDWQNMVSPLTNSAMVIYNLAQLEPASTILPDAVNYLVSNRQPNGAWSSTYETAWTLLAITEYMRGTGELSGEFAFGATLNGAQIASGQAGGDARLVPVVSTVPVDQLFPQEPNALLISREPGNGRLYYTAALNVFQPVDDIAPLNRGFSLSRLYIPRSTGCLNESCPSIQVARTGEHVTVRLTLTLPNPAYNLLVEDYIPAGTEILNTRLKTSQLGDYVTEPGVEPAPLYSLSSPFSEGWGWWLFSEPQIYDDHIAWAADYLPAGTYELTYTLVALQAGQYHVLPARAWQFYFPEVQGNSAGSVFEVTP